MPLDDRTEAALEAEVARVRQALETELIALRNVWERGRRSSLEHQAAAQTARMAAATTDRLLSTLRTRVLNPIAQE